MGKDIGGSIQYGYNFEMLNTFKMGHLKKTCSHIPSRMDPSQTPGSRTRLRYLCIENNIREKTSIGSREDFTL